MACDDRQLTEAQRVAGYQNQRTGVQQAVRPFSGRPTLENLIDYINRELQPAVRRTRDAVNDVYLQVADNAPSGNPLAYYFSTETGAADPTVGRIRLDASPQNTATTIRISQTNARLADVTPWLDVMAGSSTTPLGVVTLSDAINPGRAIRFDLSTMVDQGDYWDLGVTVIESTHPDPFVEDEAVVLAFIPGVASTGTTVPPGALTPIAAQSVLGNPTSAVAAPVAIALNDLSVLGRAGVLGTNVAGIDVPGTGTFTGESVFLRVASTRLAIQWRPWTLVDMPEISTSRFVGNVSGATARPAYTSFGDLSSNSITFEFTGETFIREQLDGDVFAAQNDNVTLIQPNVVSDTKLRDSGPLSVIGRAANSTGDPADISAVAASGAVLRESGSTVGFGTIATAGLTDDSVTNAKLAEMAANTVKANATSATANPTDFAVSTNTVLGRVAGDIVSAQLVNAQITDATIANAKLANMVAGTVKGRLISAATGAPTDLTGTEQGSNLRLDTRVDDASTSGSASPYTVAAATNWVRFTALTGAYTVNGCDASTSGKIVIWHVEPGATGSLVLTHNDGALPTNQRFFCPGAVDLTLTSGQSAITIFTSNRHRVVAVSRQGFSLTDGDKGDITVSASGATWTIDNDAVSDAKLRNSAALSVIGRSANSTGDPADIAATAASDAVLRESGSVLGFGTVATGGIANNAVTDAKLRQGGALSVIGRSANSTGNVADVSAVAASGAVLRESGSTLGFGQIATAGITDGAVTLAKLANLAAGTVIGRQIDAGTGVPVALTGNELGENLRIDTRVDDPATSGTGSPYQGPSGAIAADTNWFRFTGLTGAYTLNGVDNNTSGRLFVWHVEPGATGSLVLTHNSGAVSTGFRFFCPGAADLTLTSGQSAITIFTSNRHRVVAVSRQGFALTDGDKGDITVSASGATWTIDNDVVSDAKLRNSAAVSVIGRAANSTGDPADIAAAANDRLLARTSDSLAFQQLTDGMVPTNTIALTKLANILDNRFLGNISGSTGAVTATDFGSLNSTTIIYESTGKTLIRQALTGDVTALQNSNATTIAANAVTDSKLRDSAALSVIGRSANSSGDPADIAAGTDGHVLRRSGTTLGFGTIATAGIADAAVTLAKQADLAQSTIIGRAESAGTGVPTALTSTQVAAIIDGEPITWSSTHNFNGTNLNANTASDITLTSGGTTTLAATTRVQITSPTRLASSLAFDSVGTTATTGASDLVINSVSVVRFTGPPNPLDGMVPVVDGQVVLLVNAHATNDMVINLEGSSSSAAANRFAGNVTSRIIKAGEMALSWYDGTSDRWRLLCRDDVDL